MNGATTETKRWRAYLSGLRHTLVAIRKCPEFPLRLAGIGVHGSAATACASDCSKTTFGQRVVRPSVHVPGTGRAGYAEIFRF